LRIEIRDWEFAFKVYKFYKNSHKKGRGGMQTKGGGGKYFGNYPNGYPNGKKIPI
jgi:hypothetical protein